MEAHRLVSRYDRMQLVDWIDMEQIHSSKILVAGAGALGNEVIKDLVLAGFRNITVVDDDTVSLSNLSRCVLFRESDVGESKTDAVCKAVGELDPGCTIVPVRDMLQDIDLSGYDLYLGCLDNISARLHLNSHAKYYGTPYVDGSTDGFYGKVQVIFQGGPCLECCMNSTHLAQMHMSFSCDPDNAPRRVQGPTVPSGITTTSVIAGMCVREAIKIVCKKENLCIGGVCYYDGIRGTTEILHTGINSRCPNHAGELCR